jgi:hypothetical protein
MKKLDPHLLRFYEKRNRKKRKKQLRNAIIENNRKIRKKNRIKDEYSDLIFSLKKRKKRIATDLHKKFNYATGTTNVKIENEFGIETENISDSFLDIASRCIDFDTSRLTLNIFKATRIWPSAITLFCSLKEWTEYRTKRTAKRPPSISSTDSETTDVNSYLTHCGFYDYVGRRKPSLSSNYKNDEVVKIKREFNKTKIDNREQELYSLVKTHSEYSSDEIELFDSIILTETFNNVIEHGIVNNDQGWWILGQYHPQHGFISLCIADNGIGIKNTLLAGPQSKQITSKANSPSKDGDFINLALFENVSGAYNASIKDQGIIIKGYKKGARRGNGLERIREACLKLKIKFSILSHYGYLFLDDKGVIIKNGSNDQRVFGGTMYAYTIPARRTK